MATDFSSKEISEIYAEGIPAEELSLRPVNLMMVGELKGKKVLDLGCGNGRYSIIFAKKGAQVVGMDVSKYQLEIAKKINSHSNINYILGDISNLSVIENSSFDLIFMNLVLPDLADEKSVTKIFREAARVIKNNGRLIFSMLHPLYLSPDQDKFDKPINFKKQNYFKEGSTYKAEAITKKGSIVTFNETHFSINFISELLNKNNFLIKRVAEAKAVPTKGIFLPKYLIIECIVAK